MPGILRWPGKTKAGSVCREPISGVDWLPTLCAAAGIEPPQDRKLDGTSLLPLFKGGPFSRSTPLYWHFLRARSSVKVAIREGDWKLAASVDTPELKPDGGVTAQDIEYAKRAGLKEFQLFNLRKPPE